VKDRQKRIALYGGTFDPVHRGHLEVARRVVQLFEIDELLFVPAGHAPHKLEREVTPALHRYAMLAIATQFDPRLKVSTVELDDPSRRYTIDTLRKFRSGVDDGTELFFIMGADSWTELTTWREWQEILRSANLIVVTRPGFQIESGRELPLSDLRVVDVRGVGNSEIGEALRSAVAPTVYLTDAAMVDVSATKIRETVRGEANEQLTELVPEPVAEYIRKYGLYKNSNED
jgi:nicotinate-nucleotide adenylyltransferase